MKKRLTVLFLILFCGMVLAGGVQAGEQKYCLLCSMNLKMFWKTSQWLSFSGGEKTGYCSIHCASVTYQKKGINIDRWQVVDYDTLKLINAYKAHFLIGSDLPGTMTPVSKLAFASPDTARQFQKKHGGTIGRLDDALERAIEGRGEDMVMIGKKMAKMATMGSNIATKYGCYKCHGQSGSGGAALSWDSGAFVDRMDSRVKIKETVLGGPGRMPAFRGKITEKELHAVTIYVWTRRPQ